jgi:hypothetical protein
MEKDMTRDIRDVGQTPERERRGLNRRHFLAGAAAAVGAAGTGVLVARR